VTWLIHGGLPVGSYNSGSLVFILGEEFLNPMQLGFENCFFYLKVEKPSSVGGGRCTEGRVG
jgi:hypothetical protein